MSDRPLDRLAGRAGISVNWIDYRGTTRHVAPETLRCILGSLELACATDREAGISLAQLDSEDGAEVPPPLVTAEVGEPIVVPGLRMGMPAQLYLEGGETIPMTGLEGPACLRAIAQPGYHRLAFGPHELTLAVAPTQSYGIGDAAAPGRRLWALAAQLYGLRRSGDGGIGDFTSLAQCAQAAAARGAHALAMSPVHAQFSADPSRFSPYAPSSRLFLNVLHADPMALGIEPEALVGRADRMRALEAGTLVDWPAASRLRLEVQRDVFDALRPRLTRPHRGDALGRDFREFARRGGPRLGDHARFEALHADQLDRDPHRWHWREWEEGFRDPRSPQVAAFAREHADEVLFHTFLQWAADRGLAGAQAQAREAGMPIGLIADLAVGTDGGGSHAWTCRRELLRDVTVGAPPDLLNTLGQNWGLTAFSPRILKRTGYAAFLEMLRASLKHAGGLRIDHVLGLRRLWLVPDGADSGDGAYLDFPFTDLLRLVALESWRHRAIIVGEDLGTVPEGLRDRLDRAGILGIRVLWFEKHKGLFIEPPQWPLRVMATTTTHDLPTAAGWWEGRDIDWRAKLGQIAPDSSEAAEREERDRERHLLWAAFEHSRSAQGPVPQPADTVPAVDAAIAFVARSASQLAAVPIEDIAGLDEAPNLPGTTDEHPNWRRRLPATVAELFDGPEAAARLERLSRERP